MTRMFSPIGGWQDVPPGDIASMTKIGWYPEGHANYVDGWEAKAALLKPKPEAEPLPTAEWKEESIEELRVKWQEKHGKKPHHLKSRKTLLSEI